MDLQSRRHHLTELGEAHCTWKRKTEGCRNIFRTLLFCLAFLFCILHEKERSPPGQELPRLFHLNLVLNLAYARITSMSTFIPSHFYCLFRSCGAITIVSSIQSFADTFAKAREDFKHSVKNKNCQHLSLIRHFLSKECQQKEKR